MKTKTATRIDRIQDVGRNADMGTLEENSRCEYLIRKLTPREYWRLMSVSDEDYDKASEVCSKSQLYFQAGNAIVVNVLTAIFGQMFEGKEDVYKEYEAPNCKKQSIEIASE